MKEKRLTVVDFWYLGWFAMKVTIVYGKSYTGVTLPVQPLGWFLKKNKKININ